MSATLSNKPLPEKYRDLFHSLFPDEKPLFMLVGDLSLKRNYDDSVIFFTKDYLIAADECFDEKYVVVNYSDISCAEVKRMYGNAYFSVIEKDTGKRKKLLRFTFSAANVADAAAEFVCNVIAEGYKDEFLHGVENTINTQRSFCPRCGRRLPRPNAECINCKGKSKMFSKFAKYAKPYKVSLAVCMILSAFTTAMTLVPPYITGYMVDNVLPSKNSKMLFTMIATLLIVYIVQHIVTAIRTYYLRRTGDNIVIDIKKDIYAKAQYLPMSFYDKTSTGSVINRVNSDAQTIQNFVLKVSQEAIVQALTLVGILVIMLIMNWKLTIFSLAPIPFVVVVGKIFSKKVGTKYQRIWRRNSAISSILADTIPGVRIVKAFSHEKKAIDKFDDNCDEWMKEDEKSARVASFFPTLMTFLVTCGSLVIWFTGGSYVINDAPGFSIGLLVSFVSYASMFYNPLNFFANFSDTYQNTLASAEKILDILDAEPEHNFGKGKTLEKIEGKIEFKDVNFSFDRSKKVLTNINLTIEPGDIVGIVGTTGSGKSTLINLIMRYYDDYEGQILLDGVDIRDIDLDFYRDQIGFVQQEPMMFRDTVLNNIAYGKPDAHPEEVFRAADIANAHDFISRLPDAYDTVLGERGIGLSGGERQRISIARAVMRNPSILIFDEATASVDSETEHLIQEAIERLIRGRTTLMIAHRLSTLRKANKIVVVDQGRIIECGTPDELLELKGKYYKLIQIQSMGEKLQAQKREENFE